jgi:hypothetical protein
VKNTPKTTTNTNAKTALALARVALGIGLPAALFYLLRAEGVADLVALAAGAVLPALGALFTLLVRRRVDGISVFMAATMGLALLTSALTGSPRFLLAKDGLLTGAWGVWFLVSARGQRPAALIFGRPLMEPMGMFAVRSWDRLRALARHESRPAAVVLEPVQLTARAAGSQLGRGTGIPGGVAGLRYMQTHISQRRERNPAAQRQGGLPCSSDSSRSATSPATRPPTTRRARRSALTRW